MQVVLNDFSYHLKTDFLLLEKQNICHGFFLYFLSLYLKTNIKRVKGRTKHDAPSLSVIR